MSGLPVHPAAMLFPPIEDDELRDLADDIRRNGLLQPIVLFGGTILDGRNRARACELAGVEPRYVEWTGPGDPTDWVVAINLHRRHLTTTQRALIAVELKKGYAAEIARAAAGTEPSLFRGSGHVAPEPGGSPAQEGHASREAATMERKAAERAARRAHVSRASVERAQKVVTDGAAELIDAVRSGDFTITAAAEVAKLPAEDQRAIVRDRKTPGNEAKRRPRRTTGAAKDVAAAPSVDLEQATPLKLFEFKAEYKRGPKPSKRTPLNEVPRLRQIEVTTKLVLRAWRWINMEWDTDQREDMTFALSEARAMTPLIEQFAERLGQILFIASGEKAALEAEIDEEPAGRAEPANAGSTA